MMTSEKNNLWNKMGPRKTDPNGQTARKRATGLSPRIVAVQRIWQKISRCLVWFHPDGGNLEQPLNNSTRNCQLQRYALLTGTLLLLYIGLTHHIYMLQIINHDIFNQKAQNLYTRSMEQSAQRGRIFDINGNLLAGNIAVQNIYAEPKRIDRKHREEIIELLAQRLDLDKDTLAKRFQAIVKNEKTVICLKDFIDLATAQKIMQANLPGVLVESSSNSPGALCVTFSPCIADQKQEFIFQELAAILQEPVSEINKKVERALSRSREIVIKREVDFQVANELQAHLKAKNCRGLRFVETYRRVYPQDGLLSNVIGFLDFDQNGVNGIEALFDKQLRPQPGKITFKEYSRGQKVPNSTHIITTARDGMDVFLTISQPMQSIAEEELAKLVAAHKPEKAYAVMMNPKTGAIMALAHYPSYNPNDRQTMLDGKVAQPHAFTMGMEPGSIMKGISVAAAMEQRNIELDSIFDCEVGIWRYGGRILHDSSGNRFGDMTVSDIIKKSSNIGTAKIALELGEKDLYQALLDFGFGRQTSLGFAPADSAPISFHLESHGRLPSLEQWSTVSITRIPIGQGILCTPLQMVQAYGALANHGLMMQPYLVSKIVNQNETTYSSPRVKSQPIQPATALKITQALKEVTTKGGTGTRAAVDGFAVAGKTGTAQKWISDPSARAKGYYSNREYVSSFIGYVPADQPEFVLLVTADNPSKSSYYGGTVCGPTFAQISERALRHLMIKPTNIPEQETVIETAKMAQ